MEASGVRIANVIAKLHAVHRQSLKPVVDVDRIKFKLNALEEDLLGLEIENSQAEPTEVSRQAASDIRNALELVEDTFARCTQVEYEKTMVASQEDKRLALERDKLEAQERMEREKLTAETQERIEREKLTVETQERIERERIAAQVEEKKIEAQAQTERDRLTAQAQHEHDKLAHEHQKVAAHMEQQRLNHELEMKQLEVQQAALQEAPAAERQPAQPAQGYSGLLPKLSIPTFEGDPIAWLNFRDLFSALVGENKAINSSQKLQYLKTALKDQAALLIANLPLTNDNFDVAWKLLSDRYSSPRDLVTAYVRRLLEIPDQKSETADGLRKLADSTREILRSLDILERTPKLGEDIITYLLSQKISGETKKDWYLTFKTKEPPELNDLLSFMEKRAEALHTANTKSVNFKSAPDKQGKSFQRSGKGKFTATAVDQNKTKRKCSHCDAIGHLIFHCRAFTSLSPQQRKQWAIQNRRCFLCLTSAHTIADCNSKWLCNQCNGRHNSLLHLDSRDSGSNSRRSPSAAASQVHSLPASNPGIGLNPASPSFTPQVTACSTGFKPPFKANTETLLFTAQVLVQARNGQFHTCRALLDCGSMSSLICEDTARQLWLPRKRTDVDILGINGRSPTRNLGEVKLCIKSKTTEGYVLNTTAIVLPRLTNNLPLQRINGSGWAHLAGVKLADPRYYLPARIDMILGQDVFTQIILPERLEGGRNQPSAFNSKFGWLLGGEVSTAGEPTSTITLVHHSLNFLLQRFWETEKIPEREPPLKGSDKLAETHFAETHERLSDGSYQVRLPVIKDVSTIGNTVAMASRRLQAVEKRLDRDPGLRSLYSDFMQEYEDLGHMVEVLPSEQDRVVCYIPHHPVVKMDSATTKLRVVFDASAASDSGVSLNDVLLAGPTVQPELFDVLIKYRCHKIALNVDLVKMYRCFKVHPLDTPLQCILWRPTPLQPVKVFELKTVTYGMKPSAYLATRCLLQLARDESANFPLAAEVLAKQTYVDDILTGGETVHEVLKLRKELEAITMSGCLKLNKWASNNTSVLADLYNDTVVVNSPHNLDRDDVIKILGVVWLPAADQFSVQVVLPVWKEPLTKRLMLSQLSSLFDPLGLLSPIVVWAKILIQKLWLLQADWDDTIPNSIYFQWKTFQEQLVLLQGIRVPRFVGSGVFELFGYCDASQSAFCACVYTRFQGSDGMECNLLTSKSKVAPLKVLSVPRLELCSAVLLAQLVSRVATSLGVPKVRIKLFSDSQIVLSWLQSPPAAWNVFISHRVAEIQDLTESIQWHHVPTALNPADLGTRGLFPSELVDNKLWFYGPPFMYDPTHNYQGMVLHAPVECLPERRKVALITENVTNVDKSFNLTELCSDWNKLQRVTAYIFRFINNCKVKVGPKLGGALSLAELSAAAAYHIRKSQRENFPDEISACRRNVNISNKSPLIALNPTLDNDNVLRVVGRLEHAPISPRRKHPIILPRRGVLTSLIVMSVHRRRLHSGSTGTLAFIRLTYWILGGLSAVKAILRRCVTCARLRTDVTTQLMGALPPCRVYANPPFSVVGTDFCGPVMVRAFKGRSFALGKAYIAIFVCMSTKSVHLELVSGLSSSDFINALRRFVARRGLCRVIYSDRGTNFVGAQRELRTILKEAIAQSEENIRRELQVDGIEWRHSPVEAPHFGGLWEGNIKIVKRHLAKVSNSQYWTVEQLSTILCEIEVCLNSRPLCPMSNDPDSLEALTPAHFLIGRAAATVPVRQEAEGSILQNYRLLSSKVQHFWNRWSKEYLALLVSRPKWRLRRAQVQIGDFVVVRDKGVPSARWRLGRIVGVIPGGDSLNRVVTIRTHGGLIQRSIRSIIVLFNENENNHE